VVGDDLRGVTAVRGEQLGGVHQRDAARRAGAEVVHAMTVAQRLGGEVDRLGQRRQARADRAGDLGVLVVDHAQHVDGGCAVDVDSGGVALLGRSDHPGWRVRL
jgi:hypothetical protein